MIAYLETDRSAGRGPGPRALRLLRALRRRDPGVRARREPGDQRVLPARGGRAAGRAAPQLGRLPAPRRARRGGRAVLRRAERAPGRERRGVLPDDVLRPRLLLEPAGHATWRTRCDSLLAHLERHGERAKLVVWAAQLARRRRPAHRDGRARRAQPRPARPLATPRHGTTLVGFTTYAGTVTAASAWDAPAERKRVRPALPESYEALFHRLGEPSLPAAAPRRAGRVGVCASRGSSGRSASSTGRRPSARATTSLPDLRPVRRGDPHRRDARGGAAGANRRLGARRAPGDLSLGTLRPASRLAARWLAN